jgi:hypothetical protein
VQRFLTNPRLEQRLIGDSADNGTAERRKPSYARGSFRNFPQFLTIKVERKERAACRRRIPKRIARNETGAEVRAGSFIPDYSA